MNSSINTYLLLDLNNSISDKRYEASEEEIDTLNPFFVNFAGNDYKTIQKYSENKPIAIYCYGINYEDGIAKTALSIFSPIILHHTLENIYKYVFVSFWSNNDIKKIVAKFKTFSKSQDDNTYTDIAPNP